MTYLLKVMPRMLNMETPSKPYLIRGYSWQRVAPQTHFLVRNMEAARGRLKQQKRRSDTDRLMMKMAVVLRTWNIQLWATK